MAHILLLEDQPTPALLLTHILSSAGHEVIWATNGSKCLALLAEKRPQVLIADIIMDGIDGIEVIKCVRSNDADLPIIALSGGGEFGMCDLLEAARLIGANEAIRKPPRDEELLAAIDRLLPSV